MSRLERTTEYWPLFVTIVPPSFGLADVEDYIAEVNGLYARREQFATLVETSATATMPGSVERRRLADWQNESIESILAYNVFTATIVHSPIIRGAMTAMNWVFRPPNEQIVVDSFREGFEACIDRLRRKGCAFSPELEQLVGAHPAEARALIHAQTDTARPARRG